MAKKKKPLISVVINTLNEEENIERCLKSIKGFADEIVVVDMHSEDRTREIAKDYGAEVYLHEKTGYVEPARNFAIEKANGKWILIIDGDEELPDTLAEKLTSFAKDKKRKDVDCVLIPRKNIIFGKWMQNSRWWPDYLPRFFKKGKITWPKQIHQQPNLADKNIHTLVNQEEYALIHYNYESLDQFLTRNRRYAEIQAKDLIEEKSYKLSSKDLLLEPLKEFLSRFFAGEAYKDGVHGLALSLLQFWVVLLTYLKVWEAQDYEKKPLEPRHAKDLLAEATYQMEYWRDDFIMKTSDSKLKPIINWLLKTRAKIVKL
jgi:glycosyltransferase involved in cell wall biosynthesis